MDPNALDRLARVIGSGSSRRRVLKTLTGGAVAAITVAVGLNDARAEGSLPYGADCRRNKDCASDLCRIDHADRFHRGQKTCACAADSECPAYPDDCTLGSCVDGICGFVENCRSLNEVCLGNNECCVRHDVTKTCSGRCGTVVDNCGTVVSCGKQDLVCSDDLTVMYGCEGSVDGGFITVFFACTLPEVCTINDYPPLYFVGCAVP
jgi:hypothetical protein